MKGNYIALQPQKPVEYKAGDYSVQFTDWLIKRGDTQKAAKIKAAEDEKKYWNEKLDKIAVDPAYTRQNFQEGLNSLYQGVIDMKSQALTAANDANLSSSEKQKIYTAANNAASQYKVYTTSLGSKDFLDRTAEAEKFIAEGNADLNSMDVKRRRMLYENKFKSSLDNNGNVKFFLPKAEGSDDVEEFDLYSIRDQMMSPPQVDPLRDTKAGGKGLDSRLAEAAQTMIAEYSTNKDGNRQVSGKGFVDANGRNWANITWGEEFNETAINTDLTAFFKRATGKDIANQEDFDKAKKLTVDYMKTLVPSESKVDTKFTNADMVGKNLKNEETRLDIQKKKFDRANGYRSVDNSEVDFTQSNTAEGTFQTQIKDVKGNVVGFKPQVTSAMPIAKNQFAGLSTSAEYDPKTKKTIYRNSYKIGKPNANGEIVFSPAIPKAQWEQIMRSNKINPVIAFRDLANKVTTTNKWEPKKYQSDNNSEYQNMKIFSSTGYPNGDKDDADEGIGSMVTKKQNK